MNAAQKRFRYILREWLRYGAQMLLLHLLYFLIWAGLEFASLITIISIVLLSGAYLIMLAVTMIVFFRRLRDAHEPPEYRYTRKHGIPATATVLSLEKTPWHSDRERGFSRIRKWEHILQLRVSVADQADYEATTAAFLRGPEIPQKGDVIQVKIHPDEPQVVVFEGKR